jgi:hypothetical protein
LATRANGQTDQEDGGERQRHVPQDTPNHAFSNGAGNLPVTQNLHPWAGKCVPMEGVPSIQN